MKRSEIIQMPDFYNLYIAQVEDIDVVKALEDNLNLFGSNDLEIFLKLAYTTYAPGKWTCKEILQHITDNERVMSYRALRISRNDKTALPSYDQDLLNEYSQANQRSYQELLNEFYSVRHSTINLFKSFSKEMLLREGVCSDKKISALALGFVISGHQLHHIRIIKEHYLPLI